MPTGPKAARHQQHSTVGMRDNMPSGKPVDAKTDHTQDPRNVSPEARAGTTGFEFVRGLANGTLPLNTIAETLGYDVVEAANGRVVVTIVPTDRHLNTSGTVLVAKCRSPRRHRGSTHRRRERPPAGTPHDHLSHLCAV